MNGFQTTVGYSGERALELAKTQQFDYLISGVVMGEMNVVDSAIAIRKLQPRCRILLVSGHAATAEIPKSANRQGNTFEILAKPVHPLFLLETLRNSPHFFIES
jgi:DNA-binding NtrC family response regulator